LEWSEFANHDNPTLTNEESKILNSDILIVGDVVYDRSVIPDLVQVVRCILRQSVVHQGGCKNNDAKSKDSASSKMAVFATTYRNAATFDLFRQEIFKCNIHCEEASKSNLPNLFPCYFQQPRSDVRIFLMTLKNEEAC